MNNTRFISEELRKSVLERDRYTCRYCGCQNGQFHIDHVYPFSKGGETSIDNLVTACEKCNTQKSNKIGIYPKPIGYFEEEKEAQKKISYKLKRDGTIIFSSLLVTGIMAFTEFIASPYVRISIEEKIAVYSFFGFSVFLSIRWIIDFFKIK